MTAKEMFKRIGYECFDDREREGLPLIILYKQPDQKLEEAVFWLTYGVDGDE